ncbi:MAG: hypothetical protein OCC45_04165 [Desulfotalea sp.]
MKKFSAVVGIIIIGSMFVAGNSFAQWSSDGSSLHSSADSSYGNHNNGSICSGDDRGRYHNNNDNGGGHNSNRHNGNGGGHH